MEKRVFVSARANERLDERRRLLKEAILNKVRQAGYVPQEFFESGIPENLSWSFENTDRVMRQCVGAIVFGFLDGISLIPPQRRDSWEDSITMRVRWP